MLSCLLITYNRSSLLEKSLESIKPILTGLDCVVEYVVSDDGSSIQHREVIRTLGFDVYAFEDRNQGLGRNCNKGLAACSMPFVLQLQDDWIYTAEKNDIRQAIEILEADAQVGIVQLNPTFSDLPIEHRKTPTGVSYCVFPNDLAPWNRSCGLRPYSDQPHLKRRDFVEELGPYLEGVPMTSMENDFKKRVANQRKWLVAMIPSDRPRFEHIGGDSSFNPGSACQSYLTRVRRLGISSPILDLSRFIFERLEAAATRIVYRLSA